MIDFSVADHTIIDKFIVMFTQFEFYMNDETRTKSVSCDNTSTVAIKFEQFDTTANLVLTAHNGSNIFSETHLLSNQL